MKITLHIRLEKPERHDEDRDITAEGGIYTSTYDLLVGAEHWKGKMWSEITGVMPPPPRISAEGAAQGQGKAIFKSKFLPLVYWSLDVKSGAWVPCSMDVLIPPEPGLVFDSELLGKIVTCGMELKAVGFQKITSIPIAEGIARHIAPLVPMEILENF